MTDCSAPLRTAIRRLASAGADLGASDGAGRMAAYVAAFASENATLSALAEAGAVVNALEHRVRGMLAIAAVANEPEIASLAPELGNGPDPVISV